MVNQSETENVVRDRNKQTHVSQNSRQQTETIDADSDVSTSEFESDDEIRTNKSRKSINYSVKQKARPCCCTVCKEI